MEIAESGDPHGASKMCVMALPKDKQLQCNGKDFYKQKDAKDWPKCNCEHHKLALKIAATNTTFGKYLQKNGAQRSNYEGSFLRMYGNIFGVYRYCQCSLVYW